MLAVIERCLDAGLSELGLWFCKQQKSRDQPGFFGVKFG